MSILLRVFYVINSPTVFTQPLPAEERDRRKKRKGSTRGPESMAICMGRIFARPVVIHRVVGLRLVAYSSERDIYFVGNVVVNGGFRETLQ